ncbi:sulfotransferase [Novipirellula sp. SH528]|uniref:sulfotransferase n=1 Tax=Novipirellula sp. SH528 TaxID=3454466 RepID=UPI003FA141F2
MHEPILICGCPGSGTSLLAKMLRHCGVFLGADAGPMKDRKFHESASFRDANNQILSSTIDFPHAPKGVVQFRNHNDRMSANLDTILRSIDVEAIQQRFWAGENRDQPWGWKDPRNSATALVWKSLFPGLRILMLERKWRESVAAEQANSLAGEWFRKQSCADIHRLYQNPVGIDRADIISVDFDRLITSSDELNATLKALGLEHRGVEDFQDFAVKVGLESPSQ